MLSRFTVFLLSLIFQPDKELLAFSGNSGSINHPRMQTISTEILSNETLFNSCCLPWSKGSFSFSVPINIKSKKVEAALKASSPQRSPTRAYDLADFNSNSDTFEKLLKNPDARREWFAVLRRLDERVDALHDGSTAQELVNFGPVIKKLVGDDAEAHKLFEYKSGKGSRSIRIIFKFGDDGVPQMLDASTKPSFSKQLDSVISRLDYQKQYGFDLFNNDDEL